jgi:hypothetical protein
MPVVETIITTIELLEVWSEIRNIFTSEDHTLNRAFKRLKNSINADNLYETRKEANAALILFNQSNSEKKYQDATIHYFKAVCFYIIALCNTKLDERKVSENFRNAINQTTHLNWIDTTIFTSHRDEIRELQADGRELRIKLNDEFNEWKKYQRSKHSWLYNLLH